ncbi:MAG: hypothetical protein R3195_10510 [Gemmatimonadota bacterium]|nr:hypothetical protein [Gemmatimonadota bacterium]
MSSFRPDSVIGVVPAAGSATRLGGRALSKEIEPVYPAPPGQARPIAFCLLERLRASGVDRAFVVSSADKVDVRDTLGGGPAGTPALDHLIVEASPAAAYTVSIGTAAAGEATVALGFPDVLWNDPMRDGEGAFARLAHALAESGAEIALGLFPPSPDYATDGVVAGDDGVVAGFEPGDRAEGLATWTLAVWRPSFSRFLEREVAARYGPWSGRTPRGELTMTQAFALAIEAGLSATAVQVSDHPFLDIGEPARLEAARAACRSAMDAGGSADSGNPTDDRAPFAE